MTLTRGICYSQTWDKKQLSALLCPRLVLGVWWALDRGAVFAQWRGCLSGAFFSRSQEPRDREQPTTKTLIRRCNGLSSARRRIRVVASHGAP